MKRTSKGATMSKEPNETAVRELVKEKDSELANLYEISNHGKEFLSPRIRQQILKVVYGNPDLALIDHQFQYEIRGVLKGIQILQQQDKSITWKTGIDGVIENYESKVIPIAPILKEITKEANDERK